MTSDRDEMIIDFWTNKPLRVNMRRIPIMYGEGRARILADDGRVPYILTGLFDLLRYLISSSTSPVNPRIGEAQSTRTDPQLQVEVIFRIYDLCATACHPQMRGFIFTTVLDWLFSHYHQLSSDDSETKDLPTSTRDVLSANFLGNAPTWKLFCDRIRQEPIRGFPLAIIRALFPDLNHIDWQAHSSTWPTEDITKLFQHFFSRSTRTLEEVQRRQEILQVMIESAGFLHQAGAYDTRWKALLDSFLGVIPTSSQSSTATDSDELTQFIMRGGPDLYSWEGDVQDRLGPVQRLQISWSSSAFEEHRFRAALHGTLVLSYDLRARPLTEEHQKLETEIRQYLFSNLSFGLDAEDDHGAKVLEIIFSYVISRPIFGLPKELMQKVSRSAREVLKQPSNWDVSDLLDGLFRHFFYAGRRQEDTVFDIPIPYDAKEKVSSLADLIYLCDRPLHDFPDQPRWRELLIGWKRLLKGKSRELPNAPEDEMCLEEPSPREDADEDGAFHSALLVLTQGILTRNPAGIADTDPAISHKRYGHRYPPRVPETVKAIRLLNFRRKPTHRGPHV
jgi:hypothetical protein